MADTKPQTEPTEMIVEQEAPTILDLPDILTEDFVERFAKGVAIYKKWISVCYRLTRETHWINHGSATAPRYSLQGPGAEALMNPLGIESPDQTEPVTRCVPLEADPQHPERKDYAYWVEGWLYSKTLKRRGHFVGYCDSRDPFFNARPGWKPATGHGDIRKSATTNFIVRGVTCLAGLRDPDPELLKEAGLNPAKITHIDYRGGKTPEDSNAVISESQGKRLWALSKQAGIDEKRLHEILIKEPWKYTSIKDIKRSHYDAVCTFIQQPEKEPGADG